MLIRFRHQRQCDRLRHSTLVAKRGRQAIVISDHDMTDAMRTIAERDTTVGGDPHDLPGSRVSTRSQTGAIEVDSPLAVIDRSGQGSVIVCIWLVFGQRRGDREIIPCTLNELAVPKLFQPEHDGIARIGNRRRATGGAIDLGRPGGAAPRAVVPLLMRTRDQ